MPTVAEIVECLDELYPPSWAEPWDAIGLVCGDPSASVELVLFAIDPVAAVAAEAIERGAGLIVTHHPLFLRGVHGVAATTPKGSLVHRLLINGVALHVAHTNADVAWPGVSDELAAALGLEPLAPLVPAASADGDSRRGLGRICALAEPEPLARFVDRVRTGLPATAAGIRMAGQADRPIRRVAVSGGAGDGYFDAARAAGADVYVTADLRHHPASESLELGSPALVDVAHWASEWPWLAGAARLLETRLAARGTTVKTHISTIVTDPWTAHVPPEKRIRP
ncbi:MAG: Nif3-like dinuclear metal center hexameric protein [Sporichthyaceae bacterium]|nr:Nif3-like dinuclear metal center hexameric protein [Sporichthyaceae bacterium]